jgi:flagellar hook-basal body complex protein FliE
VIVPVGAVGGGFSLGQVEGLGTQQTAGAGEPASTAGIEGLEGAGQGSPGAAEGTGAAEGAGAPEAITPIEGGGQAGQTGGAEGGESSFGSALTEAISSLENAQSSATSASQSLATGTVKDPESAIATVEDAALTMQLAAQIRTKATEAVQTIFQTQA